MAKSVFSFVQLLAPNKQWNVIKAKVWARLTPIWTLVPLSHYIAWIVPLWVNIYLLSNTLARLSLIFQNGRQNCLLGVRNRMNENADLPCNMSFFMFSGFLNSFVLSWDVKNYSISNGKSIAPKNCLFRISVLYRFDVHFELSLTA